MTGLPAAEAVTRRPLRGRLSVRMGLALCLGAAVILMAADAWSLRLQRRHLERLVSLSADRIAETIRGATRDAMMRNDTQDVHRIIQNVGAQQGITRIRIFNKEGRIGTSTLASEVGTLVDVRAEQCTACHRSDRPLVRLERNDRVRVFSGTDGQRNLGIIAPIHNEPQCTASCHAHPASQRVLGVLDVQLSMAAVDESLRVSERHMSVGLLATVAAVLLLVGALLWRFVLSPVRLLDAAMARVAVGDLDTPVPVTSNDEMGGLARSWNAMTDELRRTRGELVESNRTLERRVEEKTRQVERAHQQMMLVEKMASLGKLAAVVAHEINNPLAGIRTYARLLRRRGTAAGSPHDDESDRILEMVDAEAGRCGDIVRNLLLFSRTSPARFAEADVAPLLERGRLLLRHQAELLGVTLEVETAPNLARVECDAAQIEQMILALAMNALEATPTGGRVALGARPEGEGVALTVSDTGTGIPEADQGRIFEPFFTTKEAGKGVGLGLAVVYGIVTRHGGQIELVSRPGAGTVFTVHLPRHPPAPEAGGTS
jgi:two-component system, NtrC family, sensor kinase